MAEKEQTKRLERGDKRIDLETKLSLCGQWIGLFLTMFFTAIAIVLAFSNHEYLATLFSTPLIIWVCSIFVICKMPKK